MSAIVTVPNRESFFFKSSTFKLLIYIALEIVYPLKSKLTEELEADNALNGVDFETMSEYHPERVAPIAQVLRDATAEVRPMEAITPLPPQWFPSTVEVLTEMQAALTEEYGLDDVSKRPADAWPKGLPDRPGLAVITVPGNEDIHIRHTAINPLFHAALGRVEPGDDEVLSEVEAMKAAHGLSLHALDAENPWLAQRVANVVYDGANEIRIRLANWAGLPAWLTPTVEELARLCDALDDRYRVTLSPHQPPPGAVPE